MNQYDIYNFTTSKNQKPKFSLNVAYFLVHIRHGNYETIIQPHQTKMQITMLCNAITHFVVLSHVLYTEHISCEWGIYEEETLL
jgi:hypothetical protein